MPVVNGVITVLPAPPGYVVNFDNPQREAVPEAFYVAGFGVFFSVTLMGQRLYTKICLSGGLQIDDVFLIIAWITSLISIALCVHMFAIGAGGVHGWEISLEKFNQFMLDVYLAAPIYTLCGSFAKLSLLIFYLRLSPQRWFRWSVWATMFLIAGYSLGIFFGLIFSCQPIAMSWDITITEGKCINRPSLYIATAVANIVSDVIIFVLPIPMVSKLQIPPRQKIGLLIIFAVGSLTVVSSIIRVSILPKLLVSVDQTWVISYASLWIIVEANLLIICAALPTLRKFFRHVAPKIIGESTYGKTTQTTGPSKLTGRRTYGSGIKIGASRDRNDYSKFGNSASECETHVMSNMKPMPKATVREGNSGSRSETMWHDDDSKEAIVSGDDIVQTTTVTVSYH